MFPEGKAGMSIKFVGGMLLMILYSLGLVKATDSTEQEIINMRIEMGVMNNQIANIEGDISEIKMAINPKLQP
jgi:hypothetical protein